MAAHSLAAGARPVKAKPSYVGRLRRPFLAAPYGVRPRRRLQGAAAAGRGLLLLVSGFRLGVSRGFSVLRLSLVALCVLLCRLRRRRRLAGGVHLRPVLRLLRQPVLLVALLLARPAGVGPVPRAPA